MLIDFNQYLEIVKDCPWSSPMAVGFPLGHGQLEVTGLTDDWPFGSADALLLVAGVQRKDQHEEEHLAVPRLHGSCHW